MVFMVTLWIPVIEKAGEEERHHVQVFSANSGVSIIALCAFVFMPI